jgi:hypothetical protein
MTEAEIPILINNFNRLSFPVQLVHWLERAGYTNIYILDNQSTYGPLLEYYQSCRHRVLRLDQNYGHLAFWKAGLYQRFRWNYFAYTDSDVLPVEDCPTDFLTHFKVLLDRYTHLDKVGFGIKIDDLPEHFSLRKQVITYESRYWQKPAGRGLFDAPIDTTFALYRPFSNLRLGHAYLLRAYRTDAPFLVRHLPWYADSENLTEEEKYYLETSNSSSTVAKQQRGESNVY